MWELYDCLIEEIPKDLTVVDVNVGRTWTVVTADNGTAGVAMTTDVQTIHREIIDFTGMKLRSVAEYVKSWNLIEATIGMAAINAWYNSMERMEWLHAGQTDERFCTFDMDVKDKDIVMVGKLRTKDAGFEAAASVKVLERELKDGTYPDSACEYMLPDCDVLLITGSAFINKTMKRLLELAQMGREKKVILTGPTVPMAPQLTQYGADRLAGLVITEPERMRRYAASGMWGPPYPMGERFYIDAER